MQTQVNSRALRPRAALRRGWAGLLLAAILLIATPLGALAAPGDLDTTFDTDGKVTTSFANVDRANAVVVQTDGKIIAVGRADLNNGDFALARYNTNGSPDTTFDTDGRVNTDFSGNADEAFAVALQADGKIVVAGNSGTTIALARYNGTNGSLDNTFDGDGRLNVDFGGSTERAYAVVVQSDNKIVIAGAWSNNFALARLNTNGSFDNTFDTDGRLNTDILGNSDEARALVLQSDDKIVAAGFADAGGNNDQFALARYNGNNGSLDNSFDTDGRATTAFTNSDDRAHALVLQGDGKLVAAGFADTGNPNNNDLALARYNTNGSLDASFSGDGRVNTDVSNDDDEAFGLVVQGDKLVVAGAADMGAHDDFVLARYTTNGALDTSFGGGGIVTTDFGSSVNDNAFGLALQSDGKLVAAGFTSIGGNTDFALARYIGGNPPVANSQTVTTTEDTPIGITLTGSDPDGNPITFSVVSNPSNGTLGGIAPNLVYTPTLNFTGQDTFTFKVNDGSLDSNVATVTINVTPVNDPPIANSQTVTTTEDTPILITLTGSDVDGNPLTFSIVTAPISGTLSGTAPNLTYTPDPDFNGTDSFTFKVNDGTVDSAPATVTINVTPVNDAPVAASQTVTTTEETPVAFTLTATDTENDPLTFSVVTPPANGSVSCGGLDGATCTYTPTLDFTGQDSFTFVANDGTSNSVPATVTINVTPVNDAPIADSQTVTTTEDTPILITLTGSDTENDPLDFTVVATPTNGTLGGIAPSLVYTPNLNFTGTDSFTFRVNDGTTDSNEAMVTINVTPVNDPPVADSQTVTTTEETPVNITLTGSDTESGPLTFSVVATPTNGTLGGIAPNLVYTPNLNFAGTDSFTFIASDATDDSLPATVTINVTPANDAPVADSQTVTTTEETPIAITLTGSDTESDPLTFSVVATPTNGTLGGIAPNLVYTPNLNFTGTDSFTFVANDGTTDSLEATVTINVTPVNDAPVALDQSLTALIDTARPITLTAIDVDGDVLTYTVVTTPTNGTLSGTAPNLTYTPDTGYTGPDGFAFQASDGTLLSNVAAISITVSLSNTAPVANDQAVSTNEDTPVAVTLTGSDGDGDTLTYAVVSQPANGTLSGTAPNLTYTPNAGYSGPDSFTFQANDGLDDSNVATVSITVNEVNVPPVANDQAVSTNEGTPIGITLTASDADGDPLSFVILSQPSNGTLTGTAPNVTYTPGAGFSGTDSFTFRVNDGTANSNDATVTITVNAVNVAPVANNQSVSTNEDTPVAITLAASDADGDPLTFTVVSGPANGTLSGTAPNLTYTPDANFNGSDSFTFKANDGTVDSNVATVSITVGAVNEATWLPLIENRTTAAQ